MNRIYLDANASNPASPAALNKIRDCLPLIGNPSSFHQEGRLLRAQIDEARALLAGAIGARAKELIFCSGASEANRLFIDMLILEAKKRKRPLEVIITPFEHPSLLKPALMAESEGYFALKILEVDQLGQLFLGQKSHQACDVLIACAAHNESGILPDLDSLLGLSDEKTIIMSDIAQAFSRLPAPTSRLDVMTFSAQKMGGLAGVGGLIIRGNAKSLSPAWPGGGQERGFRPGTESALLILAAGAAAVSIEEERLLMANLASLRDNFEARLQALEPTMRVLGKSLPRLPNTSAICFPNENPDALRIACDMAGLSVGFGSACSGLAPTESFALSRMGLSAHEQKTTVRFSFGSDISAADIDEAVGRIKKRVLSHKPHALYASSQSPTSEAHHAPIP